jgi:hypothetical protein
MRTATRLFLAAGIVLGHAQAQTQAPAVQWDVRSILKEISEHAARLLPVLDTVNPASWANPGAPEAYESQWKSTRAQAQALQGDAAALIKNPEKLSESMKVFFRMQSVEFMLGSLGNGIRRYDNPAKADHLASIAAENGANRERFQQHVVELAARLEEEYEIMDYEAQRCRDIITRQPPAAKTRKSQQ